LNDGFPASDNLNDGFPASDEEEGDNGDGLKFFTSAGLRTLPSKAWLVPRNR